MVSLPFFQSNLPCCPGEGDSHTRSDLEGPATQLNPTLIQKSTPCVPRALLCHLYVRQHKANPRFSSAGNEIRYNGPNVFGLCSTSSELYRLPAEQTGRAGLPKKLSRLESLLQRIRYFSVFYNSFMTLLLDIN